MALKHLKHEFEPAHLVSEAKRILSKYWRKFQRLEDKVVTLEPAGGKVQGEVLISYILDPFLLAKGKAMSYSHTHFWETWTMAQTFVDLGFRVDAISWANQRFLPQKSYDFLIDVRLNLERLAPHLPDAVKIAHLDTAHFSFHNPAQEKRLAELQERRGITIQPQKMVVPNRQIETADCATLLGNTFTRDTYAFAGKPMTRIPISVPFEYPWAQGKDFDAVRKRFLWFGSGGLVHKGLDLVLEAFAGLPDFHLTICGPIRKEKDFERAYFKELYETPNIHTWGWIDVGSEAWLELTRNTLGLVYPSCSEGGGSSALTCMHAGLIPIVTYETSIDVESWDGDERGILLRDVSVETLQNTIRELADRTTADLESMAHAAWTFSRSHHTKAHFKAGYREFAEQIVYGSWQDLETG